MEGESGRALSFYSCYRQDARWDHRVLVKKGRKKGKKREKRERRRIGRPTLHLFLRKLIPGKGKRKGKKERRAIQLRLWLALISFCLCLSLFPWRGGKKGKKRKRGGGNRTDEMTVGLGFSCLLLIKFSSSLSFYLAFSGKKGGGGGGGF